MAFVSSNTTLPPDVPTVARSLVLPGQREAEVVAFEEAVVAFFIEAAALLGAPKSVAAIYGICFAAPEPVSFSDIEERLDISRGSISQGLRVLREVGALKTVTTPMDRREFFTPDLELRKMVSHWLEGQLERQLTSGRSRLQAIAKAVPGDRHGNSKILKARLKSLQSWHDKTRALLPIVRTFLKLT